MLTQRLEDGNESLYDLLSPEMKLAEACLQGRFANLPVKKDPARKPVVYTITYSAADATGNRRTASVTVTSYP